MNILAKLLGFLFIQVVFCDMPQLNNTDYIFNMTQTCFQQTQIACKSTWQCTDLMTTIHGCYDQCADNSTFYTISLCTLRNSYGCGTTDQKSFLSKLFEYLQNCLINSRITEQCHNDEYYIASTQSTSLQKLNAYNTNMQAEQVLEEYVYSNCTGYLVNSFDSYFQCFNDTFNNYNSPDNPNFNQDAANLGSGRIAYYQQELVSMSCYQQDVSLCSNYQQDLANCQISIYILHSCLDSKCQFFTDPHAKQICQIQHFEDCANNFIVYNQIVKLNLGCVFSTILLVLSNLFFIYILIF
ncbi:hypothetical protein ABPG72_000762 [Tetrahymena utriculariae]